MSVKRAGFDHRRSHGRASWSKSAVGLCFALLGALLLLSMPALADAGGGAPEAPITEPCGGPVLPGVQRLCGTLNPGSSAKVGHYFAYKVGSSCVGGSRTPAGAEVEGEGIKVEAEVSGLAPNTLYTFCLVATNASGETQGEELSFKTPREQGGPPEAPITEACGGPVVPGVQRLCGTLNPEGAQSGLVGYYFAYNAGSSCMGGNNTPAGAEVRGEGIKVEAEVSGLTPNALYTYCLVATNASGQTAGAELSFKAAGAAPTIDGESVESITQTAVTLQAQINPNNQATNYAFEYSPSESLAGATTVPGGSLAAGLGDQQVGIPLAGVLVPHTTYFYKVTATNATGTSEGPLRSFETPSMPPPPPPPPPGVIPGPEGPGIVTPILPRGGTGGTPGSLPPPTRLTNAQKLAKALKACRKLPRRQRAGCERRARKIYATKAKKGSKSGRAGMKK